MNVLVIGADVIGSVYASYLHELGQRVTILARGRRRADLRQHGLILQNALSGEEIFSRLPVVEHLEPADEYDLIIVAVQANQIASVLPMLAANQRTPNILFMINAANGYDSWSQLAGNERFLVGFPSVGGVIDGSVVRFVTPPKPLQATTVGKLDGHSTPPLCTLAAALRHTGFPVQICSDVAAWKKTHVACVLPLATALYAAAGDPYRLARMPQVLTLVVRAIREGFQALQAVSVPITPAKLRLLQFVPAPLIVYAARLWVGSRHFETFAALHADKARNEIQQLAHEFKSVVLRAGIPTPAMDKLESLIGAVEHDRLAKATSGHGVAN